MSARCPSPRQFVIGTAGHIDHGKTALVKALTGVDTDRLPEEKARGITIDLGFAHLSPSITIIDVPGHERLIKNMVAGVSTIDLVLFVVAANDGIMPQTREHLDIVRMLGIPKAVFALTKADLVDREWLRLVEEELRTLLQSTPFQDAPIIPTSTMTGMGIPQLRSILKQTLQRLPPRKGGSIFRMPIDRVFSRKGFGTIVTGTVLGGEVRIGEVLEIQPIMKRVRIRTLQTHGVVVNRVSTGFRAAINLAGTDTSIVRRGMVLVTPGLFYPVERLNAHLQVLPSSPIPLRTGQRIRLHLHTGEVLGRLIIPSGKQLIPGESAYVQVHLERPVHAAYGDRFIIRQYSPQRTVAGGVVLQTNPPRYRKKWQRVFLQTATMLHRGSPEQRILALLNNRDIRPLDPEQIQAETGLENDRLTQLLNNLQMQSQIFAVPREGQTGYLSRRQVDRMVGEIQRLLRHYHDAHPLWAGMPRKELLATLSRRYPPETIPIALEQGIRNGDLQLRGDRLALPAFRPVRSSKQEQQLNQLRLLLESAGWAPPPFEAICQQLHLSEKALKPLLAALVAEETILPLNERFYLSAQAFRELIRRLQAFFQNHRELSVAEFKSLLGISRKHAIPLLEFLDARHITRREGNLRFAGKHLEEITDATLQ